MLGCERLAAVRPSRLKRVPTSVSAWPALSSLIATGRSRTSSRPRNTTDMPPEPISRSKMNLSAKRITRVIIGVRRSDCRCRGLQRVFSEGLDALVIQPVELPLPILDDAHPGPREKLRSPGVIQPDLERHVRSVPRYLGHRIPGELHVSERVDVLLLRPLLDRTDLVLQALGEISV